MKPIHALQSWKFGLSVLATIMAASISFSQDAQPKANAPVLEGRGFIVPVQLVQIGSEVGGQVVEVSFEEGQLVKKGEVLVRLDSVKYEADVKRAEAVVEVKRARLEELKAGVRPEEIQQAEANVKRAEAEREQKRANLERIRRLKANAAISPEELARAELEFQLAEIDLQKAKAALKASQDGPRKGQLLAAEAEVKVAMADLEKARYSLDRTRIRAPSDGTILKKNVEPGSVINALAFPLGGTIAELADLTKLELDVAVSERDFTRVFQGQNCEVRCEAFPETVFKGKVARILPVADRARACVVVRIRIVVPDKSELRPEMSGVVKFLAKE